MKAIIQFSSYKIIGISKILFKKWGQANFYHDFIQRVLIRNLLKESLISCSQIDKIEKEGPLLYHIDHTPCKDSEWVQKKTDSGEVEAIAAAGIRKLRNIMRQKQQNYISIITIMAESITPITDNTALDK